MAVFKYKTIDERGNERDGTIEALNIDLAIGGLQRRGFVVVSIEPEEKKSIFETKLTFGRKVTNRDIVILSRQIATLFQAQVPALRVFNLLSTETENELLRSKLGEVAQDLQGGSSVAKALEKHPEVFSSFYVNMVRAGEESGRLDETFEFLAGYLDRMYELTSKARNALIYPTFIVFTFIAVMVLVLTFVIPRVSAVLLDAGQELPIYTKIVLGASSFLINYGIFLLALLIAGGFFMWKYIRTSNGARAFDQFKLSIPYVGTLYRKLFLARLADNMNTMLTSGIPMVRAIEITSTVIGNRVYQDILREALADVKGGRPISQALSGNKEIPQIMVQMIKIGEETGNLGSILKTLSRFYEREVSNAVDALVGLIEPIMIVLLGLGIGFLLASVLIPIYNLTSAI